jgi:hypothetical protein
MVKPTSISNDCKGGAGDDYFMQIYADDDSSRHLLFVDTHGCGPFVSASRFLQNRWEKILVLVFLPQFSLFNLIGYSY